MATSYRITELAQATGVTPRAIRFYVERGLLPSPEFRSSATTYGDEHLHRLRAMQRLRRTEKLRLDAIRRRFAKLSPAEIAALAGPPPAEAPPRAAGAPAVEAPEPGVERWDRVPLLPGLELHVRSDAPPLLRRLAEEIRAQYGASRAG